MLLSIILIHLLGKSNFRSFKNSLYNRRRIIFRSLAHTVFHSSIFAWRCFYRRVYFPVMSQRRNIFRLFLTASTGIRFYAFSGTGWLFSYSSIIKAMYMYRNHPTVLFNLLPYGCPIKVFSSILKILSTNCACPVFTVARFCRRRLFCLCLYYLMPFRFQYFWLRNFFCTLCITK